MFELQLWSNISSGVSGCQLLTINHAGSLV